MEEQIQVQNLNAVALKLPTFWSNQPDVWFSQAEAQFAIRGIVADDTKFYHVISALDQETACRVRDICKQPPATNKYNFLKQRLTDALTLTVSQRADRIIDMPKLGDERPSSLMDKMLSLLDDNPPGMLFRQHFLRCLPEEIRTALAQSTTTDMRQLALEADRVWAQTTFPASSMRFPDRGQPSANQSQRYCYYHARFGPKARNFQRPCSFKKKTTNFHTKPASH